MDGPSRSRRFDTAAAAAVPALPDWVGAEVERRSLRRVQRREVRGRRWVGRWVAVTTTGWSALAALSPVGAVLGGWEWLLLGVAALARAGLGGRELAELHRDDAALRLPGANAPSPWALRGSAAAAPLRRGEAALGALVALARSLGDSAGPSGGLLRGAVTGAVEVVDGLRLGAGRMVACETAMRAITDPQRRAGLVRTHDELAAAMVASAAGLDDLLVAAVDVVGGSAPTTADLARLHADTELLREYAGALRSLAG
ncbi:hypothetical protein MXD59_10645 [Frankia sp. Ag45/Mut15]|uniref:Integral membrane protein n=1 Tax=Frankia umida TaxID=573489 RepID=A0ABT0JXF6_9ACTN|nr:hypothetical protein [Frankia umida]MCK9876229.1 hypothetical protein [Frankia umida]